MLKRKSSGIRLAVGVVLVNLFIYLLVGVSMYNSRRQYERQAALTTQNLAHSLEITISDFLEKMDIALFAIKNEAERELAGGGINEKVLNAYIRRENTVIPIFEAMWVADGNGNVAYGTNIPTGQTVNIADREYFQRLRANPEPGLVISKPVIGRITKTWSILVTKRINNSDGSFAGLALGSLRFVDYFDRLFSELNVGKQGIISLRDEELGLIDEYPKTAGSGGQVGYKIVSALTLDMIRAHPDFATYNTVVARDGIDRTVSYKKITGYPFYVFVALGRYEYLSAWRKEVAVQVSLLLVFSLITTAYARMFFLRRVQTALREEEARAKAILEASPVPLVLIDKQGIISYLNNAFTKQIGYSQNEIPTLADWRIRAYPDPQYRQMIIDKMAKNLEDFRGHGEHVASFEANVTCKDGIVRNFIMNVEVLQPDSSEGILESLYDITERKQAEESLRNAEAKYRSIFEGGLEGIYEISVEGQSLTANPAMVKMLGYDSEDEVRSSITDAANQLWVNPIERLKYTQLLETQDVVRDFEAQIWRKDRTKIWVSINGRRVIGRDGRTLFYSAFVEDITERKRAEAALRESEERFRQVAENVGDFIWEVDAQGLYRYTSPSVKKILGYTPDELVGKMHFYDLFTPEVREELKAAAFQAFAAKQPFRAFPNPNLSKDGRVVHLETSGSPVLDAAGNLTGYIGVDSDVTERHKLEAHLQQAAKMEALGTLTGGIAHDFNNILAAIMGFAELVKGKLPKGSREEGRLQMVMDAGLRGRELIRQMLTFSRQTPQEKKPLLLSAIVNETGKFLRASIPATISIRVNVESESGLVLADPVQIQQVVTNLCTNAAHAMREKGGTLDIVLSDFSVAASNGDPHGIAPGLYMRLTVRDAGVGIPPEIVDKIFDPFFTTKKVGEGTGLGLSVVMGIVKQSQGYITVESEPGRGSTFTVYFPKVAEKPIADAAVSDEPIPTGSERILLVDDEKPLVMMGEELLAELGYQVTSRTNSRQALELLKQDASRFDLVLTDQTMPDMTGVELAREILAIRPELPVILCTGFSHLVDADSAKAAGIKGFVMKPLTKGEIARTVRKVLDG